MTRQVSVKFFSSCWQLLLLLLLVLLLLLLLMLLLMLLLLAGFSYVSGHRQLRHKSNAQMALNLCLKCRDFILKLSASGGFWTSICA